jgi:Lon protease-like protein
VNECIQNRQPFGVVLIEQGRAEGDPNVQPVMVGCTAQITQVQPLRDGRMTITTVGRERFRILSLKHDRPYLIGLVEMHPMAAISRDQLASNGARLRVWVDRYLTILKRAGQVHYEQRQLPGDPLALAYLASVLLQQISLNQKQELLESEDALEMLAELQDIYRREVSLLDALLDPPEHDEQSGNFSMN